MKKQLNIKNMAHKLEIALDNMTRSEYVAFTINYKAEKFPYLT